jgi:hypothetical protein
MMANIFFECLVLEIRVYGAPGFQTIIIPKDSLRNEEEASREDQVAVDAVCKRTSIHASDKRIALDNEYYNVENQESILWTPRLRQGDAISQSDGDAAGVRESHNNGHAAGENKASAKKAKMTRTIQIEPSRAVMAETMAGPARPNRSMGKQGIHEPI